jgi:hypothetical protein
MLFDIVIVIHIDSVLNVFHSVAKTKTIASETFGGVPNSKQKCTFRYTRIGQSRIIDKPIVRVPGHVFEALWPPLRKCIPSKSRTIN